MVYIVISVLIFGGCLGGLVLGLGRKHISVDRQLDDNFESAKLEIATKKQLLKELAEASLGLIAAGDFEQLESEIESLEENIRAERGRLTITEAELEAVDTRLRELEELKRELEVSNMDAVKELDMLRAQERDVKAQNDAIREQLESSVEQLEMLLDMLASSAAAVARLNAAKNELVESEKKCSFYAEQIAAINSNYMNLKKAYDALDIEYAQLYEKQQAAEAGQEG